ncbi:response regulator transcription factor [Pelagibius litoralis]|uniref:Response regulator transcription factor n=1 Tax=Pelagibius litoralis TaxID=374515 RepID=A0A967F0E0_9PROT|nr:response regulator [Pelagibius litoralis]NIA70697.1 response regulator transcription factor [Pelagibius litoralis]
MESAKNVTFLLVEDDEVDVMCIQRAFRDLKIANPMVVARNGIEGLAVLRGEDGFEKVQKPFIVLLDLNMPMMNGIEFLDAVRDDPDLKTAVVFVLTTSKHDRDRVSAYERNVAGYVVKAKPMETFVEAMGMIDHYWRVVELP